MHVAMMSILLYSNIEPHIPKPPTNRTVFSVAVFKSKLKEYAADWTNWLDDLAILLTLLVIPFRIANLDEQWMFVALAYIIHCLRIFKFASIYR